MSKRKADYVGTAVIKLAATAEQYNFLEKKRKDLGFDTIGAYLRYMIDAARLDRRPY